MHGCVELQWACSCRSLGALCLCIATAANARQTRVSSAPQPVGVSLPCASWPISHSTLQRSLRFSVLLIDRLVYRVFPFNGLWFASHLCFVLHSLSPVLVFSHWPHPPFPGAVRETVDCNVMVQHPACKNAQSSESQTPQPPTRRLLHRQQTLESDVTHEHQSIRK